MNAAPKLQNTFKQTLKVAHKKEEVLISEREMAIYNHVKLKMAYQKDQAQGMYDAILRKEKQRLHRLQRITTRSIIGVMGLAIIGLIISRIL
jgi:hypothetical protein